jgi:hypothetical protein
MGSKKRSCRKDRVQRPRLFGSRRRITIGRLPDFNAPSLGRC